MFTKPKATDDKLQTAIDALYADMANTDSSTQMYSARADQLVKLYSLKDDPSKSRVNPDTLVTVAGNLLGILIIVGHERAHVVTSKALSFVMKAK